MVKAGGFLNILITLMFILMAGPMGCGLSADEEKPPEPFQIVMLSDTHVRLPGYPDDEFYDNRRNLENLAGAVDLINSRYQTADFVVVTGDLVGCLFSENPSDYLNGSTNPAEMFLEMMDRLIKPLYVVLGNHDYQIGFDRIAGEGISTDSISRVEAVWNKVLGIDPYYSFVHKGIRFIFLNSNRGSLNSRVCPGCIDERFCTGSFDPEQLLWLEARLQTGVPAVLFCHHPPQTDSNDKLWTIYPSYLIDPLDPFYEILERHKEKVLAIFSGHGHFWQSGILHGSIAVYEVGATGDMMGRSDNIAVVDIDPAHRRVSVGRHH